jgi:hypothetical protein
MVTVGTVTLLRRERAVSSDEQALIIRIEDFGPTAEMCDKFDVGDLDGAVRDALGSGALGSYDGAVFRQDGITLTILGRDARALFAAVRPALEADDLCARTRAQAFVRCGPEGSPEERIWTAVDHY